MGRAGFVLEDGIGERLKRGWIHFTEENERDALKPESASNFDYDMDKKKKGVH
ncbi:MAG TPA: hypothetical protein VJM57_07560 [Thermodesulfobacteriota bacterium]|nr:hypothetical protein [Thermodesulfobacteriota bacterium]